MDKDLLTLKKKADIIRSLFCEKDNYALPPNFVIQLIPIVVLSEFLAVL